MKGRLIDTVGQALVMAAILLLGLGVIALTPWDDEPWTYGVGVLAGGGVFAVLAFLLAGYANRRNGTAK